MSEPKGVDVSVRDLGNGDTGQRIVPPGDYLIVAVQPAYIAHTAVHANGTHVVTIKGRTVTALPPPADREPEPAEPRWPSGPDRCGCTLDADNPSGVCPRCHHREHGSSGCRAALQEKRDPGE